MDKQTALETLIAFACCGVPTLCCDECPYYLPGEDEVGPNNCNWTDEKVAEAVRTFNGGRDG